MSFELEPLEPKEGDARRIDACSLPPEQRLMKARAITIGTGDAFVERRLRRSLGGVRERLVNFALLIVILLIVIFSSGPSERRSDAEPRCSIEAGLVELQPKLGAQNFIDATMRALLGELTKDEERRLREGWRRLIRCERVLETCAPFEEGGALKKEKRALRRVAFNRELLINRHEAPFA